MIPFLIICSFCNENGICHNIFLANFYHGFQFQLRLGFRAKINFLEKENKSRLFTASKKFRKRPRAPIFSARFSRKRSPWLHNYSKNSLSVRKIKLILILFKPKHTSENLFYIHGISINNVTGFKCPISHKDCGTDDNWTFPCVNFLRVHYQDDKTDSGNYKYVIPTRNYEKALIFFSFGLMMSLKIFKAILGFDIY